MPLRDDPEIKRLAENNEELRRLLDEHTELDRRVTVIDRRHVRTPAEEMERKRLSKLKLANRDRISQMVARLKKQKQS